MSNDIGSPRAQRDEYEGESENEEDLESGDDEPLKPLTDDSHTNKLYASDVSNEDDSSNSEHEESESDNEESESDNEGNTLSVNPEGAKTEEEEESLELDNFSQSVTNSLNSSDKGYDKGSNIGSPPMARTRNRSVEHEGEFEYKDDQESGEDAKRPTKLVDNSGYHSSEEESLGSEDEKSKSDNDRNGQAEAAEIHDNGAGELFDSYKFSPLRTHSSDNEQEAENVIQVEQDVVTDVKSAELPHNASGRSDQEVEGTLDSELEKNKSSDKLDDVQAQVQSDLIEVTTPIIPIKPSSNLSEMPAAIDRESKKDVQEKGVGVIHSRTGSLPPSTGSILLEEDYQSEATPNEVDKRNDKILAELMEGYSIKPDYNDPTTSNNRNSSNPISKILSHSPVSNPNPIRSSAAKPSLENGTESTEGDSLIPEVGPGKDKFPSTPAKFLPPVNANKLISQILGASSTPNPSSKPVEQLTSRTSESSKPKEIEEGSIADLKTQEKALQGNPNPAVKAKDVMKAPTLAINIFNHDKGRKRKKSQLPEPERSPIPLPTLNPMERLEHMLLGITPPQTHPATHPAPHPAPQDDTGIHGDSSRSQLRARVRHKQTNKNGTQKVVNDDEKQRNDTVEKRYLIKRPKKPRVPRIQIDLRHTTYGDLNQMRSWFARPGSKFTILVSHPQKILSLHERQTLPVIQKVGTWVIESIEHGSEHVKKDLTIEVVDQYLTHEAARFRGILSKFNQGAFLDVPEAQKTQVRNFIKNEKLKLGQYFAEAILDVKAFLKGHIPDLLRREGFGTGQRQENTISDLIFGNLKDLSEKADPTQPELFFSSGVDMVLEGCFYQPISELFKITLKVARTDDTKQLQKALSAFSDAGKISTETKITSHIAAYYQSISEHRKATAIAMSNLNPTAANDYILNHAHIADIDKHFNHDILIGMLTVPSSGFPLRSFSSSKANPKQRSEWQYETNLINMASWPDRIVMECAKLRGTLVNPKSTEHTLNVHQPVDFGMNVPMLTGTDDPEKIGEDFDTDFFKLLADPIVDVVVDDDDNDDDEDVDMDGAEEEEAMGKPVQMIIVNDKESPSMRSQSTFWMREATANLPKTGGQIQQDADAYGEESVTIFKACPVQTGNTKINLISQFWLCMIGVTSLDEPMLLWTDERTRYEKSKSHLPTPTEVTAPHKYTSDIHVWATQDCTENNKTQSYVALRRVRFPLAEVSWMGSKQANDRDQVIQRKQVGRLENYAGLCYFFTLKLEDYAVQTFFWWRKHTQNYTAPAEPEMSFLTADTIHLDAVLQDMNVDQAQPDWVLLYFKAIYSYIVDYQNEVTSAVDDPRHRRLPRPLLMLRLNNTKMYGAVNMASLCFFLRRYLGFGLAASEAARGHAEAAGLKDESGNPMFKRDFHITEHMCIYFGYLGPDPSQENQSTLLKLESSPTDMWLIRPLPTAEEWWIMLLQFSRTFITKILGIDESFFFSGNYDALVNRDICTSSIAHCIYKPSFQNSDSKFDEQNSLYGLVPMSSKFKVLSNNLEIFKTEDTFDKIPKDNADWPAWFYNNCHDKEPEALYNIIKIAEKSTAQVQAISVGDDANPNTTVKPQPLQPLVGTETTKRYNAKKKNKEAKRLRTYEQNPV